MPRPRHVLIAMVLCAAASLMVGAGATASVAPGTLAIIVSPADVGGPPAPDECTGLTFDRTVVGTVKNDVIQASDVPTLVFGLGGHDVIVGGDGRDCLVGGDGVDVIDGRGGNDVIVGGDGNDRLAGGAGSDRIHGGGGNDRLFDAQLALDSGGDGDGDKAIVVRSEHARVQAARRDSADGAHSDSNPDLLDGGAQRDRCSGSLLDTFVDCEQVLKRRPEPDLLIPPDNVIGRRFGPDSPGTPGAPGTPTPTDDAVPSDPAEPPIDPSPPPTAMPEPTSTPTSAPEATPPPTPQPTPQPTAEPPPEPTPEPTAEPTPEPTRELAPDPTPDPTPIG